MNNEVMTAEQLQNALGRLALSSNAVAESVGLIQNTLTEHNREIMRVKEDISSIKEDFETEKARARDRERIEADEVNHVTQAIKSRVKDLLDDSGRIGDMFGLFTAKCRADAQRYSYYRGRNAVDTKRMYYRELLEYIGKWTPEGYGGVSGYISHIDEARRKRLAERS